MTAFKWTFFNYQDLSKSLKYSNPVKQFVCGSETMHLLMKNEDDTQNIAIAISAHFQNSPKLLRIQGSIVIVGPTSHEDQIHLEIFQQSMDKQTTYLLFKHYIFTRRNTEQITYSCGGKLLVEYKFSGSFWITQQSEFTFRFRIEQFYDQSASPPFQSVIGLKQYIIIEDTSLQTKDVDNYTNYQIECVTNKANYEFNKQLGFCEIKKGCPIGQYFDEQQGDCKEECESLDKAVKVFPFLIKDQKYCLIQSNMCDQNIMKNCELCDYANLNCIQYNQSSKKSLDKQLNRILVSCEQNEFLKQGKCLKCSDYIGQCAACKNENECILCDVAYYISKANGAGDITSCLPCQEGCMRCTEKNECEECQQKYNKIINQCVLKCNDKQFRNAKNICEDCPNKCKTCLSSHVCQECESDMILQENICVEQCSLGYFQLGNRCLQCMEGCGRCQQSTSCMECIQATHELIQGTCTKKCRSNQFRDINSNCMNCSSNCQSCSKTDKCSECEQNYYLQDNFSCLSGCAAKNQFKDDIHKKCQNCVNNCLECNSSADCKNCINGYVFVKGGCNINCLKGYFRSITDPTKCEDCSDYLTNCMTCDQSSECLECKYGSGLEHGQCVSKCQKGYYIENKVCLKCTQGCADCQDDTICNTCELGYTKVKRMCTKLCPNGQFQNQDKACVNCIDNCKICDNNTECLLCNDKYAINHTKECDPICNQGEYLLNKKCQPCMEGCKTCSSQNVCQECLGDAYDLIEQQCYKRCLQNQIRHSTNRTKCEECTQFCQTCDQQKQKCIECLDSFELKNNEQCVKKTCTQGYFPQGDSCQQCPLGCYTCNSLTECTNCLNLYQPINNLCYLTCKDNQFRQLNSINQCKDCPSSCKKCDNELKCTECIANYELKNDTCLAICSEGQFNDGISCMHCMKGCAQCSQLSHCNQCQSTYDIIGNTCLIKCDVNQFRRLTLNNVCETCPSNCSKCTDDNNCLECTSSQFALVNNKCYEICHDGQYLNGLTCEQCLEGCTHCTALDQCTTCKDNYTLINNKCYLSCPSQTFRNQFKLEECLTCPSNCLSCSSQNECLICEDTYFLLNKKDCMKSCPDGTYSQNNKECLSCKQGCVKCQSITQCSQCDETQFELINSQCLTKCSDNSFRDSTTGTCQNCSLNCKSCLNQNTCKECDVNYVLQGIECTQSCQEGYFESNKKCLRCMEGCLKCSSEKECSVCSSNYQLLLSTQCYPICKVKEYRSKLMHQCLNCNQNCAECESKDICTKCDQNYKLVNDQCLEECLQHQYRDQSDRSCKNCHEGCLSCADILTCNLCNSSSHQLYQNRCIPICNNNQFREANQNCSDCLEGCLKCSALDNCQICSEQNNYIMNQSTKQCFKQIFQCGDGIIQQSKFSEKGEECDDYNTEDGDGCNKNCKIEDGYICNYDEQQRRSVCKEYQYNKFTVKSQQSQDSSNPHQVIIIYFSQALQMKHLQSVKIKEAIKVDIEEMIEGADYEYECEIVSDTKIKLNFILKKSIKNKNIKVAIVNQEFSILNNFSKDISYRMQQEKFPNYVQISEEQKEQAQTIKQVGTVVSSSIMSSILPIILFSNFSLLFNTLDLFQMIFYLRYVNIRHPYNITKFLDIFKQFQFPFTPNLYDLFSQRNYGLDKNGVSKHLYSPNKYLQSDIDCIFLQNAGQDVTQYLILLAIYFFLKLISHRLVNPCQKIRNYIANKVTTGWEWGWHLDCLWEMYLNIVTSCFLTFFEIAYHPFTDVFSIINYFLAIVITVVVFSLPIIFFLIIKRNQFILYEEQFQHKWGMLYEGLQIMYDPSDHLFNNKSNKNFDINFLKIIANQKVKIKNIIQILPLTYNQQQLSNDKQTVKRQSQNSVIPSSNILQDDDIMLNTTKQIVKTSENINLSKLDRDYFNMKKADKLQYLCKYYYVILYARKLFFGLFIVYLHDSPLIQLLILDVLNVFMFLFLVIIKPFKRKIENIKSALCEALIFISLTTLKVLIPDSDNQQEEKRMQIGWVFIACCCLILIIQLSFVLYEFLKSILLMIKKRCSVKKNQIHPEVEQNLEQIQVNDNLSIISIPFHKNEIKQSKTQKTTSQTQMTLHFDQMQKRDSRNEDFCVKNKDMFIIPIQEDKSFRQDISINNYNPQKSSSIFLDSSKEQIKTEQNNQIELNQIDIKNQSIFQLNKDSITQGDQTIQEQLTFRQV